MKRRMIPPALCAVGMLLLILDSRQAASSAREAIELCTRTVIPSLFPFFLLSGWMARSGGGNLIFSGLFGGYPVGAQALAQAQAAGSVDRDRANRMLGWCSQAGPSFLFGIAGAQFPSMGYGWCLWAIQLLSALSVGLILSPGSGVKTGHRAVTARHPDVMVPALRAMGSVCGWVVVFRVIIGFLQRWFFFFLPDMAKILISGLLELTNGCLMLESIPDLHLRFLLCLIFLNFGGVCVVLQTISVAGNLDIRYYLTGKLLQTGFAVLYGLLFLGHWGAVLPLSLIFSPLLYRRIRKNSSIPVSVGV